MKRCIIITAYNPSGFPPAVKLRPEDTVICADSGWILAKEMGIRPDHIIGDFDSGSESGPPPKEDPFFRESSILCVPSEKDDTDTMLCVKKGLELGMDSFFLIGGMGGRLDHTVANLQSLAFLREHGKDACLVDPDNRAFLFAPGTYRLEKEEGFHFSLFAFSDRCMGITLYGAKYPLTDFCMTNAFPLGVSNEFEEETVSLSFTEGRLLVILSRG